MNNTNIVSTPNIKWDISSCSIISTKIESWRNIFTKEYKTLTINNCNHETKEFNSWDFTEISTFIIVIVWIILFMWTLIMLDKILWKINS